MKKESATIWRRIPIWLDLHLKCSEAGDRLYLSTSSSGQIPSGTYNNPKERKGNWKQQKRLQRNESVFPPGVCLPFLPWGYKKEDAERNGWSREGRGNVLRFIISTGETHEEKHIIHGKAISSMWRRLAAMHAPPNLPLSTIFSLSPLSARAWFSMQLIKPERRQKR